MSLPIPGILMITEAQVMEAMRDVAAKHPEGCGIHRMYGIKGKRCLVGAVLDQLGLPVPSENEAMHAAMSSRGSLAREQYGFTVVAKWLLTKAEVENDINQGQHWHAIVEMLASDLREGLHEVDRPR